MVVSELLNAYLKVEEEGEFGVCPSRFGGVIGQPHGHVPAFDSLPAWRLVMPWTSLARKVMS